MHGGRQRHQQVARRRRREGGHLWLPSSVQGSAQQVGSLASMSASLIGRLGSSTFRLSTVTVSGSLAGACFSPESARGPFHHGVRGRGGTIFTAALPNDRQVQADMRTHLIHRPARDTIPPRGGARVFSYCDWSTWLLGGCSLSGPAELSAINPDAVHDHCQPSR